MSYQEALPRSVTRKLAKRAIEAAGSDWPAFVAEYGDRSVYMGGVVQQWIGA